MFDEIVKLVKQQLSNNPEVATAVPPEQQHQVSEHVATEISQQLASQSVQHGGIGGLLAQLQNAATSGSPVVNAIEGGVIGSLAGKFKLPPAITGAIAAALPSLLQKLAHKANDPNDPSITHSGLGDMLSKLGGGGLGNLFNRN